MSAVFARSRLIRLTAAVVPALLTLAACGSTKTGYGDPTTAGFGAVSVSGSFGKTPTLTWNALPAYPATTQVKTLSTGTGPAVGTASVDLHVYIADPERDVTAAATKCDTASPAPAPSGSSSAAPSPVPVPTCSPVSWPLKGSWAYTTTKGKYDTIAASTGGIWATILNHAHVGSRIEALAGSDSVFPAQTAGAPAGAAQLGIGSHDPVAVVVDVMRKTPVSPTPSDAKAHPAAAGSMPKVLTDAHGNPTGFDWAGVKKPALTTPVQVQVLRQGHGPAVKSSDTVKVNYFGMTYRATQPFDQSYGKTPLDQPLSGLVKGWAIGLTGVKVGSRVLIQIPPAYGYGATGNPPTIPGNATLWFVVDVLGTSKG